ncbi:S9 family peptidase [Paractinoplanes ferrugineus]|nr:prolyl oligopeptidase family serine peptidase [Actinoplanes ferrugineus]
MSRPLPVWTAAEAAAAAVVYDEVRADGRSLCWLQTIPEEDGRVALMRMTSDGVISAVSPAGTSVGSDLHGYGGGAYATRNELAWYVDAESGHVFLNEDGDARVVLERRHADEYLGDLAVTEDQLWCVRETSSGDELVQVSSDGSLRVIAATDGFFGSPRPYDGKLAWLRWDRDRMPWDGSELMVASHLGDPVPPERVSGGREESVTQPQWDHRGRLWFLSDRTGWWNLYKLDGNEVTPVALMEKDLAPPEWEAGYRSYVLHPSGGAVMIEHNGPHHQLLIHDGTSVKPLPTPFTSFKPYLTMQGWDVVGIGASPVQAPHIFRLDLLRPEQGTQIFEDSADAAGHSVTAPQPLRVPSPSGGEVQALVYPPVNAAGDWCAPLVVRAHPGPTSAVHTRLDWHTQLLTSNGFAVADVDYHGSTGYGRPFRRSLYGRWGDLDVDDCAAVAEYLLAEGRTMPGQVFITGSSAGGYTALQAVSRPSVFSGAVARSAIVNPSRWMTTAPRWQRPHAVGLAGPVGAVRAEVIDRPTLLIHGADDHIAPLSDVADLARQLAVRAKPCQLIVLDARHTLSAQQATALALQAELTFYRDLMAP